MRLSKLLIGILLFIGSATYAQHSPQDTLTAYYYRYPQQAIDAPYTITVYGTPAEETISGKVVMLENGCTFEELDVALMMHGGPQAHFVM